MERHLFVITRDPTTDPSAIYTLRIALGLQRRQHDVSVVLADAALPGASSSEYVQRLEPLVSAGARLLALTEAAFAELDSLGCPKVSQDALADLLTQPGTTAQWC
jgi:hypothetical protein